MSLDECISKHTYRQYTLWIRWLENQLDVPSPTDWYIMKLTRVVEYLFSNKTRPALETYKLSFGRPTEDDLKAQAAKSKSVWGAILGSFTPKKDKKAQKHG
jgi:hypothetical protein